MTIHEYLEEGIILLTISPIVDHFQVVKRRETATDGYLGARAILADKGILEISLYCQLAEGSCASCGVSISLAG